MIPTNQQLPLRESESGIRNADAWIQNKASGLALMRVFSIGLTLGFIIATAIFVGAALLTFH